MNSIVDITFSLPADWERLSQNTEEAPHLLFEVLLHDGEGFRMRYYKIDE